MQEAQRIGHPKPREGRLFPSIGWIVLWAACCGRSLSTLNYRENPIGLDLGKNLSDAGVPRKLPLSTTVAFPSPIAFSELL